MLQWAPGTAAKIGCRYAELAFECFSDGSSATAVEFITRKHFDGLCQLVCSPCERISGHNDFGRIGLIRSCTCSVNRNVKGKR